MDNHMLLRQKKSDIDKFDQALHITKQIIQDLSPEATLEILRSCDLKGADSIFDIIFDETHRVLFSSFDSEKGKRIESVNLGYLDKLSESVEEELRCEDLGYFITSVLPDFEMNWHHYDWSRIPQMYKKWCVLASRDHGKSFLYSNAYSTWQLYRYKPKTAKERNNNRGFLFSFSIMQAIDLLDIMKDSITNNDILRERLYNKDKWSKMDITCKNRARLTVKGFGSSVRGAHPYWILIDDGIKDNVLYSSDQNQKSIDYFHAVIENLLVPDGNLGLVGTPFRSNDLYGHLKTNGAYKVFEYPGIFPDGSLLWENRWNFKGLMDKRQSQGNLIFSREILVKPVTSDSTIFPIEILNTAFHRMDQYTLVNNRESFPIKFNKVVTGCDFAISGSVGADYSVFMTWGISDDDKMWLLNVMRAKGMSFGEQIANLKRINSDFRPEIMLMENNVFQQIFVDEATKSGLPVIGSTTTKSKNDLREGLPSLAIMFERGMFRIPTGDQKSKDFADMLTMEFSSVAFTDKGLQGTGDHDDIAMATYKSVEGARKMTIQSFDFTFI